MDLLDHIFRPSHPGRAGGGGSLQLCPVPLPFGSGKPRPAMTKEGRNHTVRAFSFGSSFPAAHAAANATTNPPRTSAR
jgi:hypothetical protein